jgi:hypothetical protein
MSIIDRFMRLLRFITFIFVSMLAFLPAFSTFASCVSLSLEEQIAMSDVVATGIVTETNKPLAGGPVITAELETIYKGTPGNPVSITGEGGRTSVTSIDVNFSNGGTYLLFLQANGNGTYTTNVCVGTRALFLTPLTSEEKTVLGEGTPALAATEKSSGWTATIRAGAIALLAVVLGIGVIQMTRRSSKTR